MTYESYYTTPTEKAGLWQYVGERVFLQVGLVHFLCTFFCDKKVQKRHDKTLASKLRVLNLYEQLSQICLKSPLNQFGVFIPIKGYKVA